nr:PREDICTED: potassium voltage-gated channel subfamily KQT member 1-like [Anolis carolinensis]XP_016846430.1 PREDICTED: potassium voltage-gated channel subfamily KQT member 1-like [Anolis carolinensis]|eukprot:XP_008101241.1 PREDICTED: potassium voltage-gated channel subfamily KQT member 1-like [Anolis carolinensis]
MPASPPPSPSSSPSSLKVKRQHWTMVHFSVLSKKGSLKPAALELAENTPNARYVPFLLSAPSRGGGEEAAVAQVVMNTDFPHPLLNLDPHVSIYSTRRPLLSRSHIQGWVYNFLKRLTGWKCFVYHL